MSNKINIPFLVESNIEHLFIKIVRYSINMSRQGEAPEIQGSEVRGSGRAIFTLVHMVFNLIDDELTVLDAQKCVGKKVDMVGRAIRLASGAVNKASVQGAKGKLGEVWIDALIDAITY
jgi:hypothetical protein